MIVLLNLNRYIGGGETLAIRFAEYLHQCGEDYVVLTADGDCWIACEARKKSLNLMIWPVSEDSVAYMRMSEIAGLRCAMADYFCGKENLRVFTFCFRDLYNAYEVFRGLAMTTVRLSHGVYHPEDVLYLSSASLRPRRIIEANRRIARAMIARNSMLFMNAIGCAFTLGRGELEVVEGELRDVFIPIPMVIDRSIPQRHLRPGEKVRVICISRFVDFKIGAVLAVMRAVKQMPEVELTVVGHGPFEHLLRLWIWKNRPSNMAVVTGVGPDQLDSIIDDHDVGYAQGTAILEIAKRGLPVLIAPYSTLRDIVRQTFCSPGVFGDVRGAAAFGELRGRSGPSSRPIAAQLKMVIADYQGYRRKSATYITEFDSRTVFPRIVAFIERATFDPNRERLVPAKPPILKRLLRRYAARLV